MWPWEHAAVAYLVYSLFSHLYYRESPGALAAFTVVFASVLPDLIDKPLAYQFGVFDTGYALGHSIFFAVPLAVFLGVVTHWIGRARIGLAFGVGYLLHPLGDSVPHYFRGTERFEVLLWPITEAVGTGNADGLIDLTLTNFVEYWGTLTASDPPTYLLVQTGVFAFTGLLWLYDGAPVLRESLVTTYGAVGDVFRSHPR